MSVYSSNRTPRSLLVECIQQQQELASSTDEETRDRALRFLETNGNTPEEMIANGWRIAVVHESSFSSRGIRVDPPNRTHHRDVWIDHADPERDRICGDIALEAKVLDEATCNSDNLLSLPLSR